VVGLLADALRIQGAVHRALAGNLQQLRAQRGIELALDRDDPLEAVDFPLSAFGRGAAQALPQTPPERHWGRRSRRKKREGAAQITGIASSHLPRK